jgi:hypothetical protein
LGRPVSEKLLHTEERVATFIDDQRFRSALPKECLRDSLSDCASQYEKEVLQLLQITLPRLAEGFSQQRRALFGFGPKANEETGTLLKVSSVVDAVKRRKLSKASVHNLNEERSVGFINYEIHKRGKQCWESASKKMIINKSMDLLEKVEPKQIRKLRRQAQEIKENKVQWQEKIKTHQKETYTDKEKCALKNDSTKYDLLEKSKKEIFPGPFTNEDEVKQYILLEENDETKNKRMYYEVRYARMICISLKQTAAVFRLKRNHKNLTIDEYTENLIAYLNNARCCRTITVEDLNNVMRGIMGRSTNLETPTEHEIPQRIPISQSQLDQANTLLPIPKYEIGEHIIAFLLDGNIAKWHLGVVEDFNGDSADLRTGRTCRDFFFFLFGSINLVSIDVNK